MLWKQTWEFKILLFISNNNDKKVMIRTGVLKRGKHNVSHSYADSQN